MTKNGVEQEAQVKQLMDFLKWIDIWVLGEVSREIFQGEPIPAGRYPSWVRPCAEKVLRAKLPKVFEANPDDLKKRAYNLGLVLGMLGGAMCLMSEGVRKLPQGMPQSTPEQEAEVLKGLFQGEEDEIEKLFSDPGDGMKLQEMAELHRGMAEASRMLCGQNKATTTTAIYLFMVFTWRLVERMPTARDFFELLTGALGPNIVGSDPKNIAQMCRRIGKTFGKPGRPRETTSLKAKR